MINTKKVLLILFSVLIPLVAIVSTAYLKNMESEDVKGVSSRESECTPYIINMIPNIAEVDQEYYFKPRIVGCSVDDVQLKLEGVDWLAVGDGKEIFGTPTVLNQGISRVVITVSSSTNSSMYVEYIVVE